MPVTNCNFASKAIPSSLCMSTVVAPVAGQAGEAGGVVTSASTLSGVEREGQEDRRTKGKRGHEDRRT